MHLHQQHIRPGGNGGVRRGAAERTTATILKRLFGEGAGSVLVAVGGPGGTGKSTFARRLADRLDNAVVLELDHYKTSRAERRKTNLFGPHPDANRMELIAQHLATLRGGKPVAVPVYDRNTGEANRTRQLLPARWIVVDGEISTYARFRDLIDFAIFIDSDWRTQLATRLGRDLETRGYSPDKAVATFLHSNLREFAEHGAASKQWADLHLFCHHDYRLELESMAQPVYDRVQDMFHDTITPVNAEGLIVAILTPFHQDGIVASRAFVEHLDWLAAAGVHRILVGGSAGEGFSLTAAETLQLLKLALEYFPGLVLFHAGGGALPDVVHLAEHAARLGADGIVCSWPDNGVEDSSEGILGYLQTVRSASDLCLFLEPPASRAPAIASLEFLRQVPHSGLIDNAGSLAHHNLGSPRLVGDHAFLSGMRTGGTIGVVSAAANAIPELFVQMERCAGMRRHGDGQECLEPRISELVRRLGTRRISAIKHLLNVRLRTYPTGVRPPLASLPPAAGDVAARALCHAMAVNPARSWIDADSAKS